MKGAILVAGTHSDAGKSLVAAGLCRALRDRGVRVAPFKAQNMALNSVVTPGGAEIGRSQAVQADAAGVEPEAAMNPVLIKPSGARHSQVVVMGHPYADADARSYQALKDGLRPVVAAALADLRARFDVVVCEGAGSPAEINLRDADLTNMWLAREGAMATIVVADIDRGGVFASLYGTLALLEPDDQALVAGFVVNRFRGEESILAPGLEMLARRTGRPTLGVLPFVEDLWLDAEDSLALDSRPEPAPAPGSDTLEVAVVRLRWLSNFTDADALSAEPGVRVRFTRSPADIARADLVIVPGTKATLEDLALLRADGIDRALVERARAGAPVLGVCGGYQMLGEHIEDAVESGLGGAAGLGLLPVTTCFSPDKLLRRRHGTSPWAGGVAVSGYEIRHGRVTRHGGEELIATPFATQAGEGCVRDAVLGTSWHGVLEQDGFRRALLGWVARRRGRAFKPGDVPFATRRAERLRRLGALVSDHLDLDAVARLIQDGPSPHLPILRPDLEVSPCSAS